MRPEISKAHKGDLENLALSEDIEDWRDRE